MVDARQSQESERLGRGDVLRQRALAVGEARVHVPVLRSEIGSDTDRLRVGLQGLDL